MANSYRDRWTCSNRLNTSLCFYGRIAMKYVLIFAIGYGVTMTWLAHEFAMENQQLTYDLNVSQTAFKIQSAQIAQGLCLPLIDMKEK